MWLHLILTKRNIAFVYRFVVEVSSPSSAAATTAAAAATAAAATHCVLKHKCVNVKGVNVPLC